MNRPIAYALAVSVCALLCGAGSLPAQAANPAGSATDIQKQMAKEGCTACHATDSQVGPAFGWIAYRYQDIPRDKAVNAAADFIIGGGTGYWEPWVGALPMPSHSNMSKAEAEALARWILSRPPVKPPPKPGH